MVDVKLKTYQKCVKTVNTDAIQYFT